MCGNRFINHKNLTRHIGKFHANDGNDSVFVRGEDQLPRTSSRIADRASASVLQHSSQDESSRVKTPSRPVDWPSNPVESVSKHTSQDKSIREKKNIKACGLAYKRFTHQSATISFILSLTTSGNTKNSQA